MTLPAREMQCLELTRLYLSVPLPTPVRRSLPEPACLNLIRFDLVPAFPGGHR